MTPALVDSSPGVPQAGGSTNPAQHARVCPVEDRLPGRHRTNPISDRRGDGGRWFIGSVGDELQGDEVQ